MPLRLDVAVLVGLILQSFFYGVFQVLFIACVYVLLYNGRTSERVNWHFLITAILMWILIGVNFALSWSRIMDGFIALQPAFREDPGAIIAYFASLNQWKEVTRTGVYVALTAVADSLFIYRLYIVWGRSKLIVVLPILLLCGSITSGVGIEVVIGTTTSGLFASSLAGWATSFFSISLVQNVITTFLIVYRIWRVNMNVARGLGNRSLWPVMAVILESGAIYSSTLLVLLAAYVSNSFVQYVALDMLVPIIGITFTLIIVRVGLGLSQSPSGGRVAPSTHPTMGSFPLQKLNINVSHQVTVDRGVAPSNSNSDTKSDEFVEDSVPWAQKHSQVVAV
ncbi:hypothetical protein JB92DRAFT_3145441 [Gautieria morchelliformis]|nr:hypothetical protein JB92DRAFT_3145441 [Gautieria morchelliformis]